MVAVGKAKVWAFSPSLEAEKNQIQLPSFDYHLKELTGSNKAIGIGKNKIVFLSYWATWCPPCIAEMPSIQKLYNAYGKQVEFVLITKEDPNIVTKFLKEKNLDIPVYSPNMQPPKGLDDRQLPTSYLIDAEGTVLIEETGASDWNSTKIRNLLDSMLVVQIAQ